MIVYRSETRMVSSEDALARLGEELRALERTACPAAEAVVRLLIGWGAFEAALADVLLGEIAMPCMETRTARLASLALGRAAYRALRQRDATPWLRRFAELFGELGGFALPQRLRMSTPEGYAHYALHPESYAEAAERFVSERKAGRAVVIGIRSIGTSLSAMVGGALEEHGWTVRSWTVRPCGHPWDRRLRSSDLLNREWRGLADAEFLIVDEGPGMSGSSFASVAEKLSQCGVPDDRISLFPSWDAPAEVLGNAGARERWARHRRYAGSFRQSWMDGMRDLSAGAWREREYRDERAYPAVQPQHEARKFLSDAGVLMKFAGIGPYGEWKLDRQRQLADAGFSTNALGFTGGYMALEWEAGWPLDGGSCSRELLQRIAEYLAFRARTFPASRSVSFESMIEMIEVNAREACGQDMALPVLRRVAPMFESRPAIEVDGRMMPHEWIVTGRGILKTDAVDHHSDHFFAGCADVVWDLAATSVEFGLRAADEQFLLDRYRVHSGDRVPPGLYRFYRIAWLAFRTGYTSMAADACAGTSDSDRFSTLRSACTRNLRRELAGATSGTALRVST